MADSHYKNLSYIEDLNGLIKPDNVIKVYTTSIYSNDIINGLLMVLRDLGYFIDLIRLNYTDTDCLEFLDPCLCLINSNLKLTNSDFAIAFISYDTNKVYLPYSLNTVDASIVLEKLTNQQDMEEFRSIFHFDENLIEPLHILDLNDSNNYVSHKTLSKTIQEILQKDNYVLFIENLPGYKTYYMKFSKEYSYKLIFIQKSDTRERYEIKTDLGKTLNENFIKFKDTILSCLVFNKNKELTMNLDSELKIILEHLKFSKMKFGTYVGRISLLKIVYEYIRQEKNQHLVFTGESGSGTILGAKSIQILLQLFF
jgi:hypothetical protein